MSVSPLIRGRAHPVSLKQHDQKDAPCRFTNTNAPPAISALKKSRSSLTPRSPSALTAVARWSAPSPRPPSSSPVEAGTRTATATPNPQPHPAKPPRPTANRRPRQLLPATAAVQPPHQRPQRLPRLPRRPRHLQPRRNLKPLQPSAASYGFETLLAKRSPDPIVVTPTFTQLPRD